LVAMPIKETDPNALKNFFLFIIKSVIRKPNHQASTVRIKIRDIVT